MTDEMQGELNLFNICIETMLCDYVVKLSDYAATPDEKRNCIISQDDLDRVVKLANAAWRSIVKHGEIRSCEVESLKSTLRSMEGTIHENCKETYTMQADYLAEIENGLDDIIEQMSHSPCDMNVSDIRDNLLMLRENVNTVQEKENIAELIEYLDCIELNNGCPIFSENADLIYINEQFDRIERSIKRGIMTSIKTYLLVGRNKALLDIIDGYDHLWDRIEQEESNINHEV